MMKRSLFWGEKTHKRGKKARRLMNGIETLSEQEKKMVLPVEENALYRAIYIEEEEEFVKNKKNKMKNKKKKRMNKNKVKEAEKLNGTNGTKGCRSSGCINQLPDDILISIVSCLSLKEAGRTSVLGTRWRYMWTSNPSLDFDSSKLMSMLDNNIDLLMKERIRYVNWVNTVINTHSGPTIDQLRLQFYLDYDYQFQINSWVRFAFGRKVKSIELDFGTMRETERNSSLFCYAFPDILNPIVCSRVLPLGFQSLSFLETFCLKYVKVTDEVLDCVITNSPCLKRLCLEGVSGISNLKIGTSLGLKYLQVRECWDIKKLEICAPNLMSYSYFGYDASFIMENFPQIVNVSIGFFPISLCLHDQYYCSLVSRVETLTLETYNIFTYWTFLCTPVFQRLTKLELYDMKNKKGILCCHKLLDAAPSLRHLTVKLNTPGERVFIGESPCRRTSVHGCLKVIEMIGFVFHDVDIEFAMHLLEIAPSLDKMIISLYRTCSFSEKCPVGSDNEIKLEINCIEQIKTKLPVGAMLVIN